nr:L-fucose isomerase [Staphylococcus delphini]
MRHDIKTLNFNGDVYNLSAFALTPGDVNAVSLDFGQESAHMYDMFDEWQSRIVKTNVMETHFPLITSDYYMIGSILYKDFFNTTYMVTGMQLNPLTVNMTKMEAEQAIAGMVNLPHSLGLTAVGHTKIACQRWPHILEQACRAVRTSQPHIGVQQRLLIDVENERGRLGLGAYAKQVQPTGIAWGTDERLDFLALYLLKFGGRVQAEKLVQYIPLEADALVQQLIRRMELGIYDHEEYERALAWTKEKCHFGKDNNAPENQISDEEKAQQVEFIVKMTLISRDLMVGNPKLAALGYEEEAEGHFAIAAGFQGQRQWTDFYPNGDFTETILNTSFDWDGTRTPYILATENDTLNGVSMLFNYLLTNTAQIFADVRTYWSPEAVERVTGKPLEGRAKDGILHLINSGSATLDGTGQQRRDGQPVMKPYWEITNEEVEACLNATEFRPATQEYFRGGGFSTNFLTEGDMPLTMVRLNLVAGLAPVLQIAEGYSVTLDEDIHRTLDERTDPTWPTTWFAPRLTGEGAFKSVYDVMNHWGANHGAISYGHIGQELITLASMLRIPVSMHNVDEADIFRPRVWQHFGTESLESADYRACATYGPVYR